MANNALVDTTPSGEAFSSDSLFEQLQSESEVQVTETPVQEAPSEPELPSKFKGKPVDEIVRSYEELEKQFGKQGQELGELRKLTDEIIKRQLSSENPNRDNSHSQYSDETEQAILNGDPDLDRVLARKLAPLVKEVQEVKKEKMANKLNESHPDYLDIVKNTEFQEWVKSNRVRLEMFRVADQEYDHSAADELFTAWKERKGIRKADTSKETKQAKEEALRNATMETGSVTESAPAKVYSRADIMRLHIEDPARYQQLQPEIMRAYAEGRVK